MPVHIYFLIHTFWYKLVAKLRKFPARALPCQPCAAWAGHKLVHCLSITLTVTQSQSCNIVTVVTSGPAGHWFRFDMNFFRVMQPGCRSIQLHSIPSIQCKNGMNLTRNA